MKTRRFLPYLLAILAGIAIMAIAILAKKAPDPPAGEYHYSDLLRNSFGWLAIVLTALAGFALGYRFRANALLIGVCLIAAFPVTALVEATVYRGSHNLIPFELGMHLAYAMPAVLGSFAGSLLAKRVAQRQAS